MLKLVVDDASHNPSSVAKHSHCQAVMQLAVRAVHGFHIHCKARITIRILACRKNVPASVSSVSTIRITEIALRIVFLLLYCFVATHCLHHREGGLSIIRGITRCMYMIWHPGVLIFMTKCQRGKD